ncbi:SAM-dependent methyltransferase [Actinomadura rupiterrae]|uniref:SAM-dependent methyltransferase n=1 Tax=Actinomadura rupiterrae TaxID=559627 RepID=UPI0020A2D369|nr:SAM-dependent methyltransferase [Actinomadura rupiterrae]MCP2336557.1 O-methyltransferase involved in polyketide biosynthesis [Actinomadura rupiterrae]
MNEIRPVPPGIDPSVPSVARMYDHYLGGKDNYASDREAAAAVIEASIRTGTDIRVAVRDNRAFLGRTVRALAEAGVRQFIDIGAGLPTQENVHQVALRAAPDARIVYVDNDPIVLVHARALLADNPRTRVIEGDLHDPAAILDDPEVTRHIDFGQPVAVVFCAILQFIPDDAEIAAILETVRGRLASGSHLVISHPFPGEQPDEVFDTVSDVYTRTRSGSFTIRGSKAITSFFAGTELLEPGIVPVQNWRNGDTEPDFTVPSYLGGVGRLI